MAGIMEIEGIQQYVNDGMEEDLIKHIIDIANADNKRTWRYISTTLNNCFNNKILTLQQYKLADAEYKAKKQIKNNSPPKKEPWKPKKFTEEELHGR